MIKRQGFSIIELLIVIAVVGILFAIATPNYLNWRATTITKEAAQQFARDVDKQRTEAKRENTTRTLSVTQTASTTYNLVGTTTVSKALPGGTQLVPISPTDAQRNISFNPPYGTTGVPLRKYELQWTANPSIKRAVHVVGVTGKVILK